MHPSRYCGTYRAPTKPHNALADLLAGDRHRIAAHALAVFLMRIQCGPNTYGRAFPLDRRQLAGHKLLGLTQWQVRRAIVLLVAVGFIEHVTLANSGLSYAPRGPDKAGWKRPVFYRIGWRFRAIIGPIIERRRRRLAGSPKDPRKLSSFLNPRKKILSVALSLGEIGPLPRPRCLPAAPDPALEAVLARLGEGLGVSAA
jgi:hypothetical protein